MWPRVHRRHPAGLAIALIIAAALAYSRWRVPPAPASGSDHDRYHEKNARCLKVVDGDTLHIDIPDGKHAYTKVRLWGVDTPEIAHSGQPAMHFGTEAREFARSRVEGRNVRIVLAPHDTRDRYERLLAYIYHGQPEEMLNEQLIAEGCGYADPRYPHPWKERFGTLEDRARRGRLGLWKDVKPEQMPAWRR